MADRLFFQDLFTYNTRMPNKIGCRHRHYWQTIMVKTSMEKNVNLVNTQCKHITFTRLRIHLLAQHPYYPNQYAKKEKFIFHITFFYYT